MPLHSWKHEQVALLQWPAGAHFPCHQHSGGEELYVIRGELIDEHGHYPAGTWLRNPPGSEHQPYVLEDTLVWIKAGHLREPDRTHGTPPDTMNELTTTGDTAL